MKNPTPEDLFACLRPHGGAVWLDGGARTGSIVAWNPEEIIAGDVDFRDAGRALMRPSDNGPGFGGVIGAIAYNAGHHVESVPACSPTPEPPVWLARFRCTAMWDGRSWTTRGPVHSAFEAVVAQEAPVVVSGPSRSIDAATYRAAVERIQELIRRGDCYQVNLSRAVHVDVDDPWSLYRRLRHNDAAFGAYLSITPDLQVISNSPELLLSAKGKALRSDPIKGTRPRGADDQAQRQELLDSEKDHAELAMIVDLVRNDLSRVAAKSSVKAGERTLVSHGNVHHTHWPVHAELREGCDVWDALGALFPPGSVTGAPKIRATERIAELESEPRGIYCGSIGWTSDDGDARWSVAIRTGVWNRGSFRYHVGGGVVHDSDPQAEFDETVAKGSAIAAALR